MGPCPPYPILSNVTCFVRETSDCQTLGKVVENKEIMLATTVWVRERKKDAQSSQGKIMTMIYDDVYDVDDDDAAAAARGERVSMQER